MTTWRVRRDAWRDDLTHRLGRDAVFMDIDSIAPGSNFEERVSEALASCSTAVILIGSEWVSARGADGRRRLDEEADYVRLEVSTASLVRR